MKQPYTKPALSIADQLSHIAHGMTITDRAAAEHALQHLSYYRLSAYWLPFEQDKNLSGPRFAPGTRFETVLALYEFDRKLRAITMSAIERLEVAIRGSWAYHLAMKTGPHGYLASGLCTDQRFYQANLKGLQDDINNSKDVFIQHYYSKYSGPPMPPVWMASEIMTFGRLSRWYKALDQASDRQAVADPFDLDEAIFVPFVHHLSVVRNTCAHHSRLWNRIFHVPLRLPKKRPVELATSINRVAGAKIHNTFAMLIYALKRCAPDDTFAADIRDHLATHPTGDIGGMGFPAGWEGRPIWNLP
ncbi:Abi family protein [Rhizobium leguminosarum]|uniref:Abi family protein n=1 Tax=Rhizobium leguminosarum TaxID=384 RepID=UPI002FF0D16D